MSYCTVIIIVSIMIPFIILLIYLCNAHNELFTKLTQSQFRNVPGMDELTFKQMKPQNDLRYSPSKDAPNYGLEQETITKDNVRMVPGQIYRQNTGRDAYQLENYVSIYDSNFGGLLGTSMGT